MENYRCTITHNDHTYRRLTQCIYNIYGKKTKNIILVTGMAFLLIGAAFPSFSMFARVVFVLLGSWLLTSSNLPARMIADEMSKHAAGKFPTTEYIFYEDRVTINNSYFQGELLYEDIIYIAKDSDYIYLIVGNRAGHLLVVRDIMPADVDKFFLFIQEKTHKSWYPLHGGLNADIYTYINSKLKNRKLSKTK